MALNDFSWDDQRKQVNVLKQTMAQWQGRAGALMPILQQTQQLFGYLPKPILSFISEKLNIPLAEIYGVATFYAQFSFIPKGKYVISVCMGTACYVKGGETILDCFRQELGIDKGETTEDGLFSIVETRCLGECALAPVVTVNDKIHSHFKTEDVKKLIKQLRQEAKEQA